MQFITGPGGNGRPRWIRGAICAVLGVALGIAGYLYRGGVWSGIFTHPWTYQGLFYGLLLWLLLEAVIATWRR